ncbi:MAG: class I SAM-dependent methyltransferase [Melioribacteraceae bacterium]|nr:class I SAM-dependent methyltransferase [Melioribacteraceae bacterium]MCF8353843.1 class I SAM-dependent methyltransferase [Melioribacteraceae bacterium]MCF8393076.1 class I SAM-dependent methyltransferase [Melioribacteraceae bacterium]MCF8419195.1 class I SAM-dependent methyltransferase [Melioribacteraceae bacterium]
MNNKNHWYDGQFYDKLIAPNQDKLFALIKSVIRENSTLIDIGCGTGRLTTQIAGKCKSVTGIDLSSKNIELAKSKLTGSPYKNIEFIHTNAADLNGSIDSKFDYAVLTFVVHEMPHEERLNALNTAKRIAEKIIIGDYLVPPKKNLWNVLNEIIEFAAGRDHYKNYKDFQKRGGLNSIADEAGLKIEKVIAGTPNNTQLLVLS